MTQNRPYGKHRARHGALAAILCAAALLCGCGREAAAPGGDAQTERRREPSPAARSVPETKTADSSAAAEVAPATAAKSVRAEELPPAPPALPLKIDARTAERCKRIFELRKAGKTDKYLKEARAYLREFRDDIAAADVATFYARAKNEEKLCRFGTEYAAGSPALLLHFADIAHNDGLARANALFARETIARPDSSFAQLSRAAGFLMENGDAAGAEAALAPMRASAAKRHQQEDLSLLECEIALRKGNLDADRRKTLETLSKEGMMPQVRERATGILETIDARNGK